MKAVLNKTPYLFLLLIFPIYGMIYNKLSAHTINPFILLTKFDSKIPFLPIFILPYFLWYIFIPFYLLFFWLKDIKAYVKTFSVIVVGEFICFLFYFIFPTTVPRPSIVENGLLPQLVQYLYDHDKPYNCFPSIHVLTTFSVMLGCLHMKTKNMTNLLFSSIAGSLIIISTLFVKQHVLLDVISSMFLTTFIYGIVFHLIQLPMKGKTDKMYVKE